MAVIESRYQDTAVFRSNLENHIEVLRRCQISAVLVLVQFIVSSLLL